MSSFMSNSYRSLLHTIRDTAGKRDARPTVPRERAGRDRSYSKAETHDRPAGLGNPDAPLSNFLPSTSFAVTSKMSSIMPRILQRLPAGAAPLPSYTPQLLSLVSMRWHAFKIP